MYLANIKLIIGGEKNQKSSHTKNDCAIFCGEDDKLEVVCFSVCSGTERLVRYLWILQ